jgi:hypothetical protein
MKLRKRLMDNGWLNRGWTFHGQRCQEFELKVGELSVQFFDGLLVCSQCRCGGYLHSLPMKLGGMSVHQSRLANGYQQEDNRLKSKTTSRHFSNFHF